MKIVCEHEDPIECGYEAALDEAEAKILQLEESVENLKHMWSELASEANESNDEVNTLTDLLYVANEKLRIIRSTLDRVFFERV